MDRVVLESPLNRWKHADIEKLIARIEVHNVENAGITQKRRTYASKNGKHMATQGLDRYGPAVFY